jgi:tetrahydromethanopterin S-methyltransferase subunit C
MTNLFGFLIFLIGTLTIQGDSNADLVNTKVDRTIELVTNQAHITTVITVENTAKSGSLKSYTFVVEPSIANKVSFIGAQVTFLCLTHFFKTFVY